LKKEGGGSAEALRHGQKKVDMPCEAAKKPQTPHAIRGESQKVDTCAVRGQQSERKQEAKQIGFNERGGGG